MELPWPQTEYMHIYIGVCVCARVETMDPSYINITIMHGIPKTVLKILYKAKVLDPYVRFCLSWVFINWQNPRVCTRTF